MIVQVNARYRDGKERIIAILEAPSLFTWGIKFSKINPPVPDPGGVVIVLAKEISEAEYKRLIKIPDAWSEPEKYQAQI